jgi:hypothetical protein
MGMTSPNTIPPATTSKYALYFYTQASVYAKTVQVLTPECRGVLIRDTGLSESLIALYPFIHAVIRYFTSR